MGYIHHLSHKAIATVSILGLLLSTISLLPGQVLGAEGEDITINDGSTTIWSGTIVYDDITVTNGSTLALLVGSNLTYDTLTINGSSQLAIASGARINADPYASGDITIESGSGISGNGRGGSGGTATNNGSGVGAGIGSATGGGGGAGHGAAGGSGETATESNSTGGSSYDSTTPTFTSGSGGGGGAGATGGNGGSSIEILAPNGTVTLGGSIKADANVGANGSAGAGGGSGGAIYLVAKEIAGSGAITALGGAGGADTTNSDDNGGGGAGGRIAVYYGTDSHSGYDLSNLIAADMVTGGNKGGGHASNGGTGSVISGRLPRATTPTGISQATDGNGYITFQTTVSDSDLDVSSLKVIYSQDGGITFSDPDLISATASTGTVSLDDIQDYQISSIDTNTGSITLTIVWDTNSSDNGEGTLSGDQTDIVVAVVPYDGIVEGPRATSSSFEVDNADPSGLASFASTIGTASNRLSMSWTAATVENNFDHYEIWTGTSSTAVENRNASSAIEWDTTDNSALGTLSTSSTMFADDSVDVQTPGSTYYSKIWAIDDYGNEATLSTASYFTGVGGSSSSSIGDNSGSTDGEDEAENEEKVVVSEEQEETEEVEKAIVTEVQPETDVVEKTPPYVDTELLHRLLRNIDRIPSELKWAQRYFERLISLEHLQERISLSKYLGKTVTSLIEQPNMNLTNEEAISVAFTVFDKEAFAANEGLLKTISGIPFVNKAFSDGIINTYLYPEFNAKEYISKGDALRVLMRASGERLKLAFGESLLENFGLKKMPFTDIDPSAAYTSYLLYLHSQGVVQGYSDGTIRPDEPVTRAEFVKLLILMYERR